MGIFASIRDKLKELDTDSAMEMLTKRDDSDIETPKIELFNKKIKAWRKSNTEQFNLVGARLTPRNLNGIDFFNVNLKRADLVHANLANADLRQANLHTADMREVVFFGTKMEGAVLTQADLRYAKLGDAKDLEKANLKGAKYNDATTFPEEFDPKTAGMQYVASKAITAPAKIDEPPSSIGTFEFNTCNIETPATESPSLDEKHGVQAIPEKSFGSGTIHVTSGISTGQSR